MTRLTQSDRLLSAITALRKSYSLDFGHTAGPSKLSGYGVRPGLTQPAFFTGGGDHVPSRIEGGFSFGQYIRIIRMNWSLGAGSQLA